MEQRSKPLLFDNPIMTVKEAAAFLRVSPKTIYKYQQLGLLPGKTRGGIIRFHRSDLDKFVRGE
ncbi:MAG: helix-turn-helix domain-containing protein [Bdellovibrionales bacterium]|nr:helix-turn-helix domain-containing protein [Bdellovibrionales bacterium]